MSIDIDLLNLHVANGVVRKQNHGSLPLSIYNYSERCQYERLWDDVTLQCRGLVMHGDKVVARPFRKFFNDTEHAEGEIPWHLPCEVTEKLDGSLLILFYFDGKWLTCTRGSFISEQATMGAWMLADYNTDGLDSGVTYLFEVIYPQNRIVVNYGDRKDVVLLTAIRSRDGFELPATALPQWFNHVRRLPPDADAKSLRSIIRDDEEGYVVRFSNGFRVKVKGQRYMELHRLISGVSSRSVWESLSQGKSFDELLAVIPDEFGDWVREEKLRQIAEFDFLNALAEQAYLAVKNLPTRKEQALAILADHKQVASAAFAALDGKPTGQILWRQLYPEFRRPGIAARIEA